MRLFYRQCVIGSVGPVTRRETLYAFGGAVATGSAGCIGQTRIEGDNRDGATIRAVGGLEPPAGASVTEVDRLDVDSDLLRDVLDVAVDDDPEAPPVYDRRGNVRFSARRVTRDSRDLTRVRLVAERFSPGVEDAVETLSALPAHDADETFYRGIYVANQDVVVRLRFSISMQTP